MAVDIWKSVVGSAGDEGVEKDGEQRSAAKLELMYFVYRFHSMKSGALPSIRKKNPWVKL